MDNFKNILEVLERKSFTIEGLLYGYLFLLLIFPLLNIFIKEFYLSINYLPYIWLVMFITWFFVWFFKRKIYPKPTNDRVGIVLAIETEGRMGKTKVYKDFTDHIERLINRDRLGDKIEIIELNEFQSQETLELVKDYLPELEYFRKKGVFRKSNKRKKWEKHKNKIGGHFYIWGRIKKRQDGDKKYFLDLNGLVVHRPIGVNVHKEFTQEFVDVWFKKIKFKEIFEFKGFEVSAEIIFLATKYIIGLASLISGDPFLALELHKSLDVDITKVKNKIDIKSQIKLLNIQKKARGLLAEENLLIAQLHFKNGDTRKSQNYLRDSFAIIPQNYGGHILQSSINFSNNNFKKAMNDVNKAKKLASNNGVWRYNKAFLLMCDGKYKNALKQYKLISKSNFPKENITLMEVENFNIKQANAGFVPSNFVLAFLKYKKSNNLPEALDYFEKFLKLTRDKLEFSLLVTFTKTCLAEIKRQMKIK